MENIASLRFYVYLLIALIWPTLLLIASGIIAYFFVYKKNTKRLNAVVGSNRIKPQKTRFVLSWLSYGMTPCIIFILIYTIVLYLIKQDTSFVYITSASMVFAILLAYLFLSPYVYPYYILAVSAERINGATKWGWLWNRTEIRLDEIDTEKLAQRQFGTIIGIKVINSIDGTQIMTMGLSQEQLSEIKILANNASMDVRKQIQEP